MTPTTHQQARDGAADAIGPRQTIPVEGQKGFTRFREEERLPERDMRHVMNRPHWTIADAVAALGGNPRSYTPHPDWESDANCAEADTELFFPEPGGDFRTKNSPTAKAKAICAGCDVKAECLAAAMNNGEQHGLWAGLTPKERTRLRRIRRKEAAA